MALRTSKQENAFGCLISHLRNKNPKKIKHKFCKYCDLREVCKEEKAEIKKRLDLLAY